MSIFKQLILLIQLMIFSSLALAEIETVFQTEIPFIKENSIIPGQLDLYKMEKNLDVVLFTGVFENDKVISDVASQGDDSAKSKLLQEASAWDRFFEIEGRKTDDFFKQKQGDDYRVYSKYHYLKSGHSWAEESLYIITSGHVAYASISYPLNVDKSIVSQISKGIKDFHIKNSSNRETASNSDLLHKFEYLNNSKQISSLNLGLLRNLFFKESFAQQDPDVEMCGRDKYVIRGEWTYKAGSALFDFQKMVRDLKKEAAKTSPDSNRLACLANLIKDARDNSSTYWAERAHREGCVAKRDENMVLEQTENCSEANFHNIEMSLKYLETVDQELTSFVNGDTHARIDETGKIVCGAAKDTKSNALDLKKAGVAAQNVFCCSAEGDEKGPLYKLVESEAKDSKEKVDVSTLTSRCLEKMKDKNENGEPKTFEFGDCASKAVDGLAAALKTFIKGISSLADMETYKAIGRLIFEPGALTKFIDSIGELIAGKVYSINNCMSSTDAKLEMCKVSTEVMAMLAAPGLFLKLVKNISNKTGLTKLVSEAAEKSKTLQKLKANTQKAKQKLKAAADPILNHKLVKPSAKTLKNIAKILGKDVSTPFKNLVKDKLAKYGSAAANSSRNIGQKIINSRITSITKNSSEGRYAKISADSNNGPGSTLGVNEVGEINPGIERAGKIDSPKTPSNESISKKENPRVVESNNKVAETSTARMNSEHNKYPAINSKTLPQELKKAGENVQDFINKLGKTDSENKLRHTEYGNIFGTERSRVIKQKADNLHNDIAKLQKNNAISADEARSLHDSVSITESYARRTKDVREYSKQENKAEGSPNSQEQNIGSSESNSGNQPKSESNSSEPSKEFSEMSAEKRSESGSRRYNPTPEKQRLSSKFKGSTKNGYEKAKEIAANLKSNIAEKTKKSELSARNAAPVEPSFEHSDLGKVSPLREANRPVEDLSITPEARTKVSGRYAEKEGTSSKEKLAKAYSGTTMAVKNVAKKIADKFKNSVTSKLRPRDEVTIENNGRYNSAQVLREENGEVTFLTDGQFGKVNIQEIKETTQRILSDQPPAGKEVKLSELPPTPANLPYPKINHENLPESLKESANNVDKFIQNVSAKHENGMRHSEFKKIMEAKNARKIVKNTKKLHEDIEKLFEQKIISEAEANSLHESVIIAESYAVGRNKLRDVKVIRNQKNSGENENPSAP